MITAPYNDARLQAKLTEAQLGGPPNKRKSADHCIGERAPMEGLTSEAIGRPCHRNDFTFARVIPCFDAARLVILVGSHPDGSTQPVQVIVKTWEDSAFGLMM